MKRPIPFGKYLLLDRVNVGGMAEVFCAKAFGVEGFERVLAIKKILPTMVEDEEFITMFIDEARISVQLTHANIVQVYELGKHDENYFIAMEYIPGRDLRTILDRYKRMGQLMPQSQGVFVASKMCEGLDYAHRKKDARGQPLNIVHRDVSPQNVLLSYEGEVKLIDFGIAKAANRAQKTQAGILKGKFGYMSPEQVRGLPINHRSDIFAVGVCLYEMLTGEKLFIGESDFSTLEKVRNAEVPLPRTVNPEISEELEAVMMKALAKDVDERYQNASDFQEDLMRFLLVEGRMYGAKQLSAYLRESFAEAIDEEAARTEAYAQIQAPKEMGSATASAAPPSVPEAPAAPPPPPPPELLSEGSDRTVLFDASDVFEGELASAPAPALSASAEMGAASLPPLPGDRESTATDPGDEEATPVGNGAARAGLVGAHPLGDAEAASHEGAVAALAADIPASPPPQAALLEQATRITDSAEVEVARPTAPRRRIEPRATAAPAASEARTPDGQPPVVVRGGRPISAVRPGGRAASSSARSRQLKFAVFGGGGLAVLLAIVAFVALRPAASPTRLTIFTEPDQGVEILVDGKVIDTRSPTLVEGLPPGTHVVVLKRPGSLERREERVTIEAGQEVKVELALGGGLAAPNTGSPVPASRTGVTAPAPTPPSSPTPVLAEAVDKPESSNPSPVSPVPSPVPEPPAVVQKGVVLLRTTPPGAQIELEGKRLGKTPHTIEGLDLETVHKFTVSKDGYRTERVEAVFDEGPRRSFDLTLKKLPAGAAVAEVVKAAQDLSHSKPKPKPKPKVRPKQPKPRPRTKSRPAVAVGTGAIIAMTVPPAKIVIDGKDTGRWTPVPPNKPIKLPAGKHKIVFETSSGQRFEKVITITAEKTEKVIHRF